MMIETLQDIAFAIVVLQLVLFALLVYLAAEDRSYHRRRPENRTNGKSPVKVGESRTLLVLEGGRRSQRRHRR